MRHPACEVGSGKGIGARILGTYELELWGIVEEILSRDHDRILVPGAGEGYYAIGLARRKPGVMVHAFEGDSAVRAVLGSNVRLNAVETQVRVEGYCGVDDLRGALGGSRAPLVICDVEGGERELLDPVAIPALAGAEILVEIHDFVDPGIGALITARFAPTHRQAEVHTRDRTRADLPAGPLRWIAPLLGERAVRLMGEGRGTAMRWFHLVPSMPAGPAFEH